jgi:hypothetical protein
MICKSREFHIYISGKNYSTPYLSIMRVPTEHETDSRSCVPISSKPRLKMCIAHSLFSSFVTVLSLYMTPLLLAISSLILFYFTYFLRDIIFVGPTLSLSLTLTLTLTLTLIMLRWVSVESKHPMMFSLFSFTFISKR